MTNLKTNISCCKPNNVCAKLYSPHTKEYCVCFQSKYASLKGIENSWAEVKLGGEACWENQQHGRNHHLKVLLKNAKKGSTYAVQLLQEDGTKAPSFTLTKSGTRKATMLIGIDSRDPRLGLSWTYLSNEGPRRWIPSSLCTVHVLKMEWSSVCESGTVSSDCTKDPEIIFVPEGRDVVIPIRVDVLSAAKGAVNFSRYVINVYETNGKESRTLRRNGWLWNSPPVLIEAKWLPTAMVRMTNKQRFHGSVNTRTNDEKLPEQDEDTSHDQSDFTRILSMNEPRVNRILFGCKIMTHLLGDLNIFEHSQAQLMQLDVAMQELQSSQLQYQLARNVQAPQPEYKKQYPFYLSEQQANLEMLKRDGDQCFEDRETVAKRTKISNDNSINNRTLSSPPRGPKYPRLSDNFVHIQLPSMANSLLHKCQQRQPSFVEFDLLATAASAKSCVMPVQQKKKLLVR